MSKYEEAAKFIGTDLADTDAPAESTEVSEASPVSSSEVSDAAVAAQTVVDNESVTQNEAVADPDPKALRAEEMRARIAALKERNAERAERARLQAERAELEAHRAAVQRERAEAERIRNEESRRWSEALKDPIRGFKELGLDPEQAYRRITDTVLAEDTPENAQAKLEAKIRAKILEELKPSLDKLAETEAKQKEFEELQKRRNYEVLEAKRLQAESDFLKTVRSNGYEELADYYDDDDLVHLGNQIASQFTAAKKPFTFQDVASEMLSRLQQQLKRAEERRTQRITPKTAPETTPAKTTAPAPKANETKTIGAEVASAGASSAKRTLNRNERLSKATQLLKL